MNIANAPATPALKSVEAFRDDESLFRFDFGGYSGPDTFVSTCPDGTLLWGHPLSETADRHGEAITLPEIVADKVVVTHAGGIIEELSCHGSLAVSVAIEGAGR